MTPAISASSATSRCSRFRMLMLVMSNNFMQLFFGWEGVGVVSYLLIGFWYTRPTATFAALKAFLVNRIGDFGFISGIAAVLHYTGSLRLLDRFRPRGPDCGRRRSTSRVPSPGRRSPSPAFACSSARWASPPRCRCTCGCRIRWKVPTPISALIHAATMVTAGIFMVARMSPLFETVGDGAVDGVDHRRDDGVFHGTVWASSTTTSSG